MSCNPSIGGVGKGHLVRELDVFDGLMARAADRAAIHRRMLNRSKGPAVHGPRFQADRKLYRAAMTELLRESGAELIVTEAQSLRLEGGRVTGLQTDAGLIECRALVIATGTFLDARIFVGEDVRQGGRRGERASVVLADQVREVGLAQGRLKTGTPPRLDGRTIDWARLEPQPSDRDEWTMSALDDDVRLPQLACAHRTHQRANARHHSLSFRSFSAVCRHDRGQRAAILSLHRGQGEALLRPRLPPDLP